MIHNVSCQCSLIFYQMEFLLLTSNVISCCVLIEVVLDTRDADIKQHFDDCFNFIDEGRQSGGGVLIHCFAGISRR